ncbi:MAG: anaerobic sulfite reductase subunit AsrA [Eubacteriales bacterium]|jgi:anaerobic sulfite reductase subunit A|nr:anaerobic sulfite reductase subunit AsrA [Lachnospiraceae bacterium]MDD5859361.1 anaerobic sulfite reductase subunit AsrA [Eubacteriales bacterium]MCI1333894.1 anaerobic sulfite reductase subunit AsrA [Lachnospiraceae bacterium]MCI1358063.1 anaerobic sulfite reductase subunit AsrA [Lachnospiraceae bacterium]MCI1378027.1 anaerobic sulfite reductase subunit AsrA [Lachnospiraceae bacterium]
MGYVLSSDGFGQVIDRLLETYRVYAPVVKTGAGRFTDTDVVMYDEVHSAEEIELLKKSDYSFKEFLTPLSETLFFYTEEQVKEADLPDKPVLIFLRSCDMHAVKRLDQMYLANGKESDWFYARRRELVKFVLIGCGQSFDNCFCASMGSNETKDGYVFSVDVRDGKIYSDVKDDAFASVFAENAEREEQVVPLHVTENETRVHIPEKFPLSILKDPMWDEYTTRCIGCGRCNFVCPTCTCWTMEDVSYTDNGRVGERRRVASSCMVDGFSTVAGGAQYRKTQGERMRFKVMHKIYDFRKRFGYDMCVGCGRCDDVCPEYISYSNIIKKAAAIAEAGEEEKA